MSDAPRRILILGGYGTFGGRLARLLADEPALTLVIAGRSARAAQAFCDGLPPGAGREAQAVDRDADLERRIAGIAPDLVVDATGPFQAYGADPYRVVRAALACGAHYLDLADGSDFVRGIARYDTEARARGLVILSGASSFPVLTAAAVRHLARDLERVDGITAGIAPSPHAALGRSVVRAVAGYAGRSIAVTRDGRPARARALLETRRYTIAPPGVVPLAPRVFSLVDVPDLALLRAVRPEVRAVWVGAAPAPAALHALLRWLAHGVRWRLLPSLAPLAPLMHGALRLRRGEHRGGMFVEIEGAQDGTTMRRSWHLIAEGDDGPFIPSMAVAAIVRNWLAGRAPAPGARPALSELELADYEPAFAARAIRTGTRTSADADGSLYRRLLGERWSNLPVALRTLHAAPRLKAVGKATVTRGPGLLARAVAALFGFPEAATEVDVSVHIEHGEGSERWIRDFGGRRFASEQYAGRGRSEWLLCERFGPFVFGLALVTGKRRLSYVVRRWTLFGVPLPRRLAPTADACEFEEAGRFRFHVDIRSPLTGPIVRYSGFLDPVTDPTPDYRRATPEEPVTA